MYFRNCKYSEPQLISILDKDLFKHNFDIIKIEKPINKRISLIKLQEKGIKIMINNV